ncbi:replication protein [Erwinia rhapontici]|uniref:replication protein n=1 Tax=Erwinia rhapontici TaxID=55212 RepID=UPI0013311FC2|nr:replication protein [Erwinia rhapontici]MBP2157149.1 phage replication O-like protein O [Erwinia rhapontici]
MSNTAEIINFRARTEREEQRVADTDDGYTRLANELYEELIGANLTRNQAKVAHAVCRKTYGFNKKLDRISDSQISELTNLPRQKVNKAKNELISMHVLIREGSQIGPNKALSDWAIPDCHQNSDFVTKAVTKSVTKSVTGLSPKQGHTKDTIQKTINTDPPKAPKGEFSEEVISHAKQVLEYYNELTGATCRSAEAFAVLLTERSARAAYTVDDLKLVVRWVVLTWKRRSGTVAKPANICRVNRFDGYLADATVWDAGYVDIDCAAVVDAYNEIASDRMPPADLDEGRKAAIREFVRHMSHKTVESFRAYFSAFLADAGPYYFGEGKDGWRAGIDYLLKPETLLKVRRGTL